MTSNTIKYIHLRNFIIAISNLTTSLWALESMESGQCHQFQSRQEVPWPQDPFSHPLLREQESHQNCVLHLQLYQIGPTQIHMSHFDLGVGASFCPTCFDWYTVHFTRTTQMDTLYYVQEYEIVQLRHPVSNFMATWETVWCTWHGFCIEEYQICPTIKFVWLRSICHILTRESVRPFAQPVLTDTLCILPEPLKWIHCIMSKSMKLSNSDILFSNFMATRETVWCTWHGFCIEEYQICPTQELVHLINSPTLPHPTPPPQFSGRRPG